MRSATDTLSENSQSSRVFLLSPATLAGVRARQLTAPEARFDAARRYRSAAGVPIAEAFSFMSALYFRGKIAYARRFARPPAVLAAAASEGIFVITPGFGLVPPDWPLTVERMATLARTPIDAGCRAYAEPLAADAERLAAVVGDAAGVVLLGSIATGKYVDVLLPIFGDRLVFPTSFVGRGDMSRGALLLRAARSGEELEYGTLDLPRRGPRAAPVAAPRRRGEPPTGSGDPVGGRRRATRSSR